MIKRNLNGPYARGVANPYTTHVHPYPTRFHGGVYTRPVFGLPYVRSPHTVFKPDDFYEYYGVQGLGGLGSFGGSSLAGNTLGLGATGSPIYYLDAKTNPKVTSIQGGLNKVLVSHGYREIPVTGKLDYRLCAAMGLMYGKFPSDVLAQVDKSLLDEAAKICNAAQKNPTVKNQIVAYAQELEANRNHTPAQVLVPQTEVVPPTTAPIVVPPAPQPEPPSTTPPVAQPVPVYIEDPTPMPVDPELTPIEIPEVVVEARPTEKSFSSLGLLAVVAGAGILYLGFRNRKKLGVV